MMRIKKNLFFIVLIIIVVIMIYFTDPVIVLAREVIAVDLETDLMNYGEYLYKLNTELNVLQHNSNILRVNLEFIDYNNSLSLYCSYRDWIQFMCYERKIVILQNEISLVQQTLFNLEWMKWWKGIETIIEIIFIWYGICRFFCGDELSFTLYKERMNELDELYMNKKGFNMFSRRKGW